MRYMGNTFGIIKSLNNLPKELSYDGAQELLFKSKIRQ